MEKYIEKNMVRERALKLPVVTDEMYKECSNDNKEMVQEFFEMKPQLSKDTKTQYRSGLRQFVYWLHTSCNDKPFHRVKKRDFNRYMSYLVNRGMSSSGLKFKKSSVSSLCGYIEDVVSEDDTEYKSFRNFTKAFKDIPKNYVYEKIPISEDEYNKLIEVLIDDENYMGAAWVSCAFNCGARRGGIRQFESSIAEEKIPEGKTFVYSNYVREKGRGVDGKRVHYMVNEEALKYIRLWLEKRGYEHKYIFTCKYGGVIHMISREWANEFCTNTLSDILGRRINAHLFKGSCVTNLLAKGKDIKVVSKYIAQHNDIATTSNFYDLRNNDEAANQLFD